MSGSGITGVLANLSRKEQHAYWLLRSRARDMSIRWLLKGLELPLPARDCVMFWLRDCETLVTRAASYVVHMEYLPLFPQGDVVCDMYANADDLEGQYTFRIGDTVATFERAGTRLWKLDRTLMLLEASNIRVSVNNPVQCVACWYTAVLLTYKQRERFIGDTAAIQ